MCFERIMLTEQKRKEFQEKFAGQDMLAARRAFKLEEKRNRPLLQKAESNEELSDEEIEQLDNFLDFKEWGQEGHNPYNGRSLASQPQDGTTFQGGPGNDGFECFGTYLQAVASAGMPGGRADPRLYETRAATGLAEATPQDGGFLVGTDDSDQILSKVHETGGLVDMSRPLRISGNNNSMSIPAVDESSRKDGSRPVRGYWTNEADQYTSSKIKFRLMQLTLHKVTALVYVTDELIEDRQALSDFVMAEASKELKFKADDAIYRGDGAGKPLGIINSPCLVTVPKEGAQAADTIVWENIAKMWSRMWKGSRANAVWLINGDIIPELYSMSLASGTSSIPVFLPAGAGATRTPFNTLMGKRLVEIEHASTLGDVADIALVDMNEYILASKFGIQSASSIHLRFDYGEQVFRFTYRLDGQTSWDSALTRKQGTGTVSPFVTLAERA